MIHKIDHINISVTDLEKATVFFTEFFGFVVLHKGNLEGEWIDTVVGLKGVKAVFVQLQIPGTETNLELIPYHQPIGTADPELDKANQIGFRHMAFTVTNIEEIVEKLKKAGVKIYSDIQTYNKKKKLCYFEGPERVILELAEYGDFA